MGNYEKKPAVIVDIDGTLADVEHRRHYVQGDKKDFTAFYEAMDDDGPATPIIGLVNMYRMNTWEIILCTGRPERYRTRTKAWLANVGVQYDLLYMRPNDQEYTPDFEVKLEMLEMIRGAGFDPQIAIDDRDQVVKMWREQGLTCLQVAEGDF